MQEVLVNSIGGLSLPRKSVVRITDCPDMTLDVYHGRKTTKQQQQQQTVQRQVRCCMMQHLIWVCTVCLGPFYRTLGSNGLIIVSGQRRIKPRYKLSELTHQSEGLEKTEGLEKKMNVMSHNQSEVILEYCHIVGSVCRAQVAE